MHDRFLYFISVFWSNLIMGYNNKYGISFLAAALGILPSQSLAGDIYVPKKSAVLTNHVVQNDERGIWTGYTAGIDGTFSMVNYKANDEITYKNTSTDNVNRYNAGVNIGYNYQLDDYVFGAVAHVMSGIYEQNEINTKEVKGDNALLPINFKSRTLYGDVVVRAGYSYDSFLFYGMGGVAGTYMLNPISSKTVESTTKEDKAAKLSGKGWGFVTGVGVDYMLDNGISIGAAYRYAPSNSISIENNLEIAQIDLSSTDEAKSFTQAFNGKSNAHIITLSASLRF
ncbi:MAG: hypothetical protein C4617_03855 [Candidatus Liberibacter europaeus]|uniref:Outer membrane protein beta-barrel domain-containing protein n=1 Tax=Candidatus Liberibacter europaeus TaxID=744859 RepID=A0A2T4VX61_9HYPH|nr:hypothetical protein [Candidatus Liberibacter europaeus]PTL86348.1 MAG: hypothetical protein C4617_03855 [Candidatus Liberibacter europaeus]